MSKKTGSFLVGAMLMLSLAGFLVTQSTVYRIQGDIVKDVNFQGAPADFTITNGVGDQTNQTYITVIPKDKTGNTVPFGIFDFWLSDSNTCGGVTATASSGTFGMIGGSGAPVSVGSILFVTQATPSVATTRIPIRVQADSTGTVKIGAIDTAKQLDIPCAYTIFSGPKAGTALTTGSYK